MISKTSQTLISDSREKMDQATYLSQTLWQFLEASAFTDLTLVCKDGEVAVHSAMLASLLDKVGFSCLSVEDQECLLMPEHRYIQGVFLLVPPPVEWKQCTLS